MATKDEAQQAILDAIVRMAPKTEQTLGVLRLAEAYAYAADPHQSHGGSAHVSSK